MNHLFFLFRKKFICLNKLPFVFKIFYINWVMICPPFLTQIYCHDSSNYFVNMEYIFVDRQEANLWAIQSATETTVYTPLKTKCLYHNDTTLDTARIFFTEMSLHTFNTHARTQTYTHIHTYTYTHMHAYTHTHIYIHAHTHT